MFIARIQGHSMEPRIPDDSLCIFRRNVVGSRHGKLVLVRNSELADDHQYTVKRYKSEKRMTEDGFVQTRIRLESLNPAYPSWDLEEDSENIKLSPNLCASWNSRYTGKVTALRAANQELTLPMQITPEQAVFLLHSVLPSFENEHRITTKVLKAVPANRRIIVPTRIL